MATAKTLADAFHETLKDVYYAEKQSVRALKKSAKAAQAGELKEAFTKHAEESAEQVERLVQVFELIGKPARAKTCEAMQGITHEMEEDLEDFAGTDAADQVLIGCAQAVEHYEIARYGLLKTWAGKLGYDEAATLLGQTLEEEKATDARLSEIAEGLSYGEDAADEAEEDADADEADEADEVDEEVETAELDLADASDDADAAEETEAEAPVAPKAKRKPKAA